jgi:hypothetical protein
MSNMSAFEISAVLMSTFEDAHRNGGFLEGAHVAHVYGSEHLAVEHLHRRCIVGNSQVQLPSRAFLLAMTPSASLARLTVAHASPASFASP